MIWYVEDKMMMVPRMNDDVLGPSHYVLTLKSNLDGQPRVFEGEAEQYGDYWRISADLSGLQVGDWFYWFETEGDKTSGTLRIGQFGSETKQIDLDLTYITVEI